MDHANSQKIIGHCPLCHSAYGDAGVKLLGENGPMRLFHCTCASCGHAVLAVIVENLGSVSSVGMVTDLEIQDALRFKDAKSVSSEECIQTHRVMEHESRELCTVLLGKSLANDVP
jgi:hypothetical protein